MFVCVFRTQHTSKESDGTVKKDKAPNSWKHRGEDIIVCVYICMFQIFIFIVALSQLLSYL